MSDSTVQHVYLGLTQKIQSCQKQLGQIEAQIGANERETRLASLTKSEVEGLDSSVPLYRSLGKMFMQESKDDILRDLNKTTGDAATLIEALEKKKKFVTRDLDEATRNLKDLVRQTQARAAASA
ncbi:hypothetical protein IWQ56_006489 [Coemansia nantahalensis]|uniref:Uncharacterized protein n=1 Tax=Coemansia helicoidea TaxID=1286919 RepID=A0ACC1KUD7_9FUNG|nr:hypothetical protein IWQ56_006489 [Coemansia nantahalensis]KAJ2794897.1 hypothetical protein H4R21_005317 [Coemansia helicoidea]